MTDLVQAGYVGLGVDGADELTESGQSAYARILAASEARISALLVGWHPELHPRLLELLAGITHDLAASDERPGRDLDRVGQSNYSISIRRANLLACDLRCRSACSSLGPPAGSAGPSTSPWPRREDHCRSGWCCSP